MRQRKGKGSPTEPRRRSVEVEALVLDMATLLGAEEEEPLGAVEEGTL